MTMGYIHLDGNKLNCSSENLMKVSLKELRQFYRRGLKRLTPELTKSEILGIRLEQLVKKKIKEVADDTEV